MSLNLFRTYASNDEAAQRLVRCGVSSQSPDYKRALRGSLLNLELRQQGLEFRSILGKSSQVWNSLDCRHCIHVVSASCTLENVQLCPSKQPL